jgi:5-formyltetrahydrofolate cyclo-ligase
VTPAKHSARKALRQSLIARREALPAAQRLALSTQICGHLLGLLAVLKPSRLGFCWPYRAEPDILPAIEQWLADAAGREAALPVVPDQAGVLAFHRWMPGARMQYDRFGIPQPVERFELCPDLILVPVNGFDAQGYRIGYGGGFFDRTLASLGPQTHTVGVGFELARLDSVQPEVHDLPLDWILTEAGYQPTRT